MLEIRYKKNTGIITACAGSPEHTGGHLKTKDGEAIVVLDISTPEKSLKAYLFDETTENLIPNPDYIEPENTEQKIAKLEARVKAIEDAQ